MSSDTPSQHELRLDVSELDVRRRLNVIRSAKKAGAIVLSDMALLIDNAPPEPKRAVRHNLEYELSRKDPFTLFIYGPARSSSFLRDVDPGYKKSLAEKVKPMGFTPHGVATALTSLMWLAVHSKRPETIAQLGGIQVNSSDDHTALTFEDPTKITAEGLIACSRGGLGDTGADTALAIICVQTREHRAII